MTDRILPTIGSKGTYTFDTPYDAKTIPEEIYTCKAIRNISEYVSYNQDPKKLIYDFYGLTDIDYEADLEADMEIVSLQNKEGVWLYVPARYILTYPIVNGIPYRQLAIVCKLPAIKADMDLTLLTTDIGNLISDYIGTDSNISLVETSRTIAVTKTESDILTASRNIVATNNRTDRSRYTKLLSDHNEALLKIHELEEYIKTTI